jgi:dethiobiotin synthetase
LVKKELHMSLQGKQYFVTGIGTDVGKTIASAVLAEALQATYWKPVQSGATEGTDRETVRQLCSAQVKTLPEEYVFAAPVSPHLAAELEGVEIELDRLAPPKVEGNLIIEGAGGLMVPITKDFLYADWIEHHKLPTIVVSRHYLGSINHTLLTLDHLKRLAVPVAGVLFVGAENKDTESIIVRFTQVPVLGRIDIADRLTPAFIAEQAQRLTLN